MSGDNRTRHCVQCNLNVYNFSEMTSAEIEHLIAARAGQRLCGRLYRRADGTILTRDCPIGLRIRIRRVSRRLNAALAAAMALVFTTQACSHHTQGEIVPPTPQFGSDVMGDISPPATGFSLAVVDPSGAPVPQARILLLDRKTGKTAAQGVTDQFGKFILSRAAGDYIIVVQAAGFTKQSKPFSIKPYHMENLTIGLRTATNSARGFINGIVAMPIIPKSVLPAK